MCTRHRPVALLLLAVLALIPGTARGEEEEAGFPAHALLPKAETGADRYLEAYPIQDGRGVVVAVFDTGVDPGAPGLQTTTDGKPKIIDIIDGTGSGDVDTTETAEATDGTLRGLSGRTLSLDSSWKNPSRVWRVGLKAMVELFPPALLPRLRKKRAERFTKSQREAVTALQEQIAAYARKHPDADEAEEATHADLKQQLKTLRTLATDYKDPGPIVDCVVWNDGLVWWGVVDTDEDGDLADEKAMRNYRIAREWTTFSKETMLNFCVNIHAQGDILSIVMDTGNHGTHVAGIVAAHVPERPEMNGIAPGAQIVAVKIGDPQRGSSSYGTGAERGMLAVLRNKCDLINMSYGGASRRTNTGHIIDLYRELVNKHGVIFVSSAGNDGPALSTVGSPGGTTSAIFGVGAYVSPAMARAQMGVRGKIRGTHFTWSSRGPTVDGDLGVDFTAPGGAIAPVPTWSLQRTTQMNGTSMSSPNACGGIALLLSGMKAEGIPVSPHRVRRALVNTAKPLPGEDVWSAGAGMIQIDRAWAYLDRNQKRTDEDVRLQVSLPRRNDARGVYLREPHEVDQVLQTSVRVKPHLREDVDNQRRVDLEMRFVLESTQPWIETAGHLYLSHGESSFGIKVDPSGLPEGVHYGEIRAYDAEARDRGVMFRVPVTVVRPRRFAAKEDTAWRETLTFEAGTLLRRFFAVPPGATWADLTVRAKQAPVDKLLVIEATQIAPGRAYKETHREIYTRLRQDEVEGFALNVVGGRTLELALSQYWSYEGSATYDVELTFHGIRPSPEVLALDAGGTVARVDVEASLGSVDLEPKGEITVLRRPLRAVAAEIRALSKERDELSKGRLMHEAVLTYEFELEDAAKIKFGVRLNDEDGGWDTFSSMIWQLFDSGDQLLKYGDAGGTALRLTEGTYTVKFHLRHTAVERLRAARDAVAFLDFQLADSLPLTFHGHGDDAFQGRKEVGGFELRAGEKRALFVPAIPWDDLPSAAAPGDVLIGTYFLGASDGLERGAGRRPGGHPIRFAVPPEAQDYEDDDSVEAEDTRSALARAEDAVRDQLLEELATLREDGEADAFKALYASAAVKHGRRVDFLLAWLRFVYGDGPSYEEQCRAARAEQAADRVIKAVSWDKLAQALGVKYDAKDPKDLATKARAEERRAALAEALHKKARLLLDAGVARYGDFKSTLSVLRRFQDLTEAPYLWLQYELELSHKHLGKALGILAGVLKEDPRDEKTYKRRIKLFRKLGWDHWVEHEERWMLRRFPPGGYPGF